VQAQIKRLDETLTQLETKKRSQLTANQREQEVGRINIQIAELEIAATNNELKKEAASARDQRIKALKELEHLKRTLFIHQDLYKADVVSRAQLDESEFRVQQAEIDYAAALRRENGTGNRVDVATAKMAREMKSAEASRQGHTKYLEELDLEIVSARQILGQARQEEASVQSLLNASVVRAPLAGVIVSMPVRHAGRIVSPGDDLFSLMPSDAELVVELQVPDNLIGQMHTGQSARFRFASFPYVEYGAAEGKIIKIASDSTDSDGRS
jgi:multidrug resistance efflux pump